MSILLILFLIQAIFVQEVGHSSIPDDTDQEKEQSMDDHFSWGKYLPPFNVSIIDLVMQIPKVKSGINWHQFRIHSFSDYFVILMSMVNFGIVVVYCFPHFRKGQTSKGFAGALERSLEKPVSGWQGIWEQFGKLVGRVAPPIYWDFTPEQVLDPDEMAHYLLEGCFQEEDPNMRFFALYWGLASAYRAAIDHFRKVMVEAGTQTEMESTPVESGTQTETTDSTSIATQTELPEIQSTAPVVQTVLSALRAMLPEIQPTPPVTQTVSAAIQTTPPEDQPTPPVAQTVSPAVQPMPPVNQIVSAVTQSVPSETQSVISEVEDSTEMETRTTNPNISIAPVSRKKRWIRQAAGITETAEYTGPAPRLRRIEREEEEGAYGPIPSENVRVEERMAEGAYGPVPPENVRVEERRAARDEEVIRLGARPKEVRPRPREEGVSMASKPPIPIRPPRKTATPEHSLLDCTSEELEEILKSQAASTSQPESYTLPPPREPREQRRSPSPQRSQPPPPRGRSRERHSSPSLQRSQPLPPLGPRERRRSPSPQFSQPLPTHGRSRERRRSPSPQLSQPLPPHGRSRERRRSPSPQRWQPLPPHGRSRERRRSPPLQYSQLLPPRERSREGPAPRREVRRRELRDPYTGAEILREHEVLRTMKPAELRDLRKDFSRRPGERILTWLVRCWDTGAQSHQLEGNEARQLGSLARDHEIELEIARETYSHSLWLRILHGVRERYPFKEYLTGPQRKWTTAEEGVQYLRELAMLELIYADPDYYDILEPDKMPCTQPMWRKIVRGAPAAYVHCLITVYHPQLEDPTVDTMCSWIRLVAEDLEHSPDVQHQSTYGRQRNRPVQRSQPRFRPRSQSQSRSRSPSLKPRRRENPGRKSRSQLWSYLRSKGENMKKWHGEPTSKLEARVKQLKQKEGDKKFVHAVTAKIQSLEKELQSLRHQKTDDKKDSNRPKHASDDECSDHSQ